MADNQSAAPAAPQAPVQQDAPKAPEAQNAVPQSTQQIPGQPVTQQAAAPETSAQKTLKKTLKELKLKIDGKETKEALPFEIPDDPAAVEYMQRQLQMAKMGQNRAQYAANLEKEIKSFVENLRKDPRKVLSDPTIGVDLKAVAKQILEEEIANAQKSPEQLEKEKLENELKAIKEEREREKKEFEQKEFERLQNLAYEQYDLQMSKALESSDLPKSPYVVKKMAEYMLLGLQNGINVNPEDVLPLVRDEIQGDIKQMFQVMPEDVIEKLVGKEKINSLRKKKVAKAKNPPPTPISKAIPDTGKFSKQEDKKDPKKQNFKQFFGV